MPVIPMTLCVIYDRERVLLGMKKRGFGAGRWNGFGGKVKDGESLESAVRRELKEEVDIRPFKVMNRGRMYFSFEHEPEKVLEVHLYSAQGFMDIPRESEEMRPEWFLQREVPYDQMWPDDKYWMPSFFEGKNIEGKVHFKDEDTMLSHQFRFI